MTVINMRERPAMMQPYDYRVVTWYHTVSPDVSLKDVLEPAFWANVARKLQPHHRVVVDCEDGSWSAKLFVREAERAAARMGVESFVDFDKAKSAPKLEPEAVEEYEIKWRGPQHKHVVVRKSDTQEMISGLSKEAARAYIADRVRVDAA